MVNWIVQGFQRILDVFLRAGNAALDFLPLCPFYQIQTITINNEILSWIAWLVPFPQIIALTNAWLAAVAVWYVAKKAMRWARIIQ